MTLGEWIRKSGDAELAALLINWMLTIVITMGGDYTKLNLKTEFDELLDYLNTPVTANVIEALKLLGTSSELYS